MGKSDRLLDKILCGTSDATIDFDEMCRLLLQLGFTQRIRGSHHLLTKPGIVEKINLQRDDGKAKPYQVRQVRNVIIQYQLGELL
ncbi:MAG: type II toxin-antitoxin system HicA family toxin [Candidatus Contendobacter sp.]|nr:type II toxin-antitoxin system HicA family toxin [Candidatus Contendobacter sp.]